MSLVPRYCERCGQPGRHLRCPPREPDEARLAAFSSIGTLLSEIDSLKAQLATAQNQVASQKELLDTVHGHVFEACQLLNVNTSEVIGDSWTLLDGARAAKEMRVRFSEQLAATREEILKEATGRIREMVRGRTWLEVELGTRIVAEIRALKKERS
jgi:hypothetical protein